MFDFLKRKKFRPNAAVIVSDGQGQVLLCERYDKPGIIQTVQGGIDKDEDPETAATRELEEELGIGSAQFEIKAYLLGTHRYEWTPEIQAEIKKKIGKLKYQGQEQHYFLIEVEPGVKFDLDAHHREFARVWWGSPQELLEQVWHYKRPGIKAALEGFGLI